MGSVKRMTLKQACGLMQPKVGTLIHELRQLTKLTQVQLAKVLGVSYENNQSLGKRAYSALTIGIEADSVIC